MRGWKASVRLLVALALSASPLISASCQNIAGIDDRTLGPCGHFCDVVMANCTGENTVYDGREKCMGVCKNYDVGDSNEWQQHDTLECRLHEAELVPSASDEEKATHCRAAGPEGLDNCGGSCESYCTLYERICGQVECGSHENCVAKCAGLRDRGKYNVVDDYEGNSLQCRFVHLSNASITPGGEPHCGHANLQTPTDHCNDVPDSATGAGGAADTGEVQVKPPAPDCADYCKVELTACGNTEYEDLTQCLALCNYIPKGNFADTTQNTLGCRIYHSYNALCAPEAHCPHSGPGGERHCGTTDPEKCNSYCTLAKGVCPSVYSATYDDDSACMTDCMTMPDAIAVEDGTTPDTRYTVTYAQTPGTVACRFLALSRAAVTPSLCADKDTSPSFGKADCATQ